MPNVKKTGHRITAAWGYDVSRSQEAPRADDRTAQGAVRS